MATITPNLDAVAKRIYHDEFERLLTEYEDMCAQQHNENPRYEDRPHWHDDCLPVEA